MRSEHCGTEGKAATWDMSYSRVAVPVLAGLLLMQLLVHELEEPVDDVSRAWSPATDVDGVPVSWQYRFLKRKLTGLALLRSG